MKYLSICSGIEASTVAWEPLGWEPVAFSEIEPFPAAVLAHHYPNVPNLGDMTKIKGEDYRGTVDVLVGGTPCQAFSVAGLRAGLVDPRGNLTLVFAKLADDIAPPCVVWENVPGVLSSKDNAFGCFLGLLAGEDDALVAPGGKWTDAGYVLGPQRTVAWRVLDAQYFGLAQRRRRAFVVACPRGGADPREILFEREGLRRDSAPSREAGQGFAADAPGCSHWSGGPHPSLNQSAKGSGGVGSSNQELFSQQGAYLVPGAACIKGAAIGRAPENGPQRGEVLTDGTTYTLNCVDRHAVCFGGGNTSGPIDVATARSASGSASGRLDFESETFAVVGSLSCNTGPGGHDAGNFACNQAVDAGHVLPICFGGNNTSGPIDVATARSASGSASGRNTPMVAFAQNTRDEVRLQGGDGQITGALAADPGMKQTTYVAIAFNGDQSEKTRSMGEKEEQTPTLRADGPCHVATAMQVRRLTPKECERLQGFPDDYTQIPWKNKPAEVCPDGPRYKALGNSMAVPCMRWIGMRIMKQQIPGLEDL